MNDDKSLEQEMDALEEAMRQSKASPSMRRGRQHLEARLAQAYKAAQKKQAISLRVDQDVLEKLKECAGEGSYQTLINRILVQWLDTMEMGGLLESKLERLERATDQLEQMLNATKQSA